MPDSSTPAVPAPLPDSDFAPRARRSAFKLTDKGALYLQFDPHHVFAIRPEPPRAWKRPIDGSKPWMGVTDLPFELNAAMREVATADALANGELAPECLAPTELPSMRASARIRRANLARLFERLDPVARTIVARDWGQGTWRLYCLICSSPEARELCATDEGMRVAWALAQARWLLSEQPPKRPLAFARRWAKKKRRGILGRLGFPPSNASVKALAKVPLAHLNLSSIHALREVLNHGASCQRAQHLPLLTRGVLELLHEAALRPLVDHAFLLELVNCGEHAPQDELRVLALLRDTARLAAQLHRKLMVFSTIAALKERHDHLASWAWKLAQATDAPFPPLPLALTAHDLQIARPLRSGVELLEEGRHMSHCLGTLDWQHQMAHAGRLVAFAVTHPTRLTLALWRDDGGAWLPHDFAGPHNEPPPREAFAWAQSLLSRLNQATNQQALPLGP